MTKKYLTNLSNYDLWCCYSKERIKVGESYFITIEKYLGETIEKSYKLEYEDCLDDEED